MAQSSYFFMTVGLVSKKKNWHQLCQIKYQTINIYKKYSRRNKHLEYFHHMLSHNIALSWPPISEPKPYPDNTSQLSRQPGLLGHDGVNTWYIAITRYLTHQLLLQVYSCQNAHKQTMPQISHSIHQRRPSLLRFFNQEFHQK